MTPPSPPISNIQGVFCNIQGMLQSGLHGRIGVPGGFSDTEQMGPLVSQLSCLALSLGNRPTCLPLIITFNSFGKGGQKQPMCGGFLIMPSPAQKDSLIFFPPSNYLNGVLASFSLKQDITFIDIVAAATSVTLTERRSWPNPYDGFRVVKPSAQFVMEQKEACCQWKVPQSLKYGVGGGLCPSSYHQSPHAIYEVNQRDSDSISGRVSHFYQLLNTGTGSSSQYIEKTMSPVPVLNSVILSPRDK